jgi:GNAT superfamily N-acetyltransferase
MSGTADDIGGPEKLRSDHDLSQFESTEPTLDDWLKRRAAFNEASGASRTYVVTVKSNVVVGFYALAAGAVQREHTPRKVGEKMPQPVPVILLGRLAVHRDYQGRGIGRGLLRDAILRTLQAADIAGIRAILVHAISEDAKRFYERAGFSVSPLDPMMLMITLAEAEAALRT